MSFTYKVITIIITICPLFLWAQVSGWKNSNLKNEIVLATDSVQLQSQYLLPEKLNIQNELGDTISSKLYRINLASGVLYLDSSLHGQSLNINYYVHPNLQQRTILSKDTALIIEPFKKNVYYTLNNSKKLEKKLFNGLNSRGSLVRGIRFGNNQSGSVQSSLDLQLTGKLSKEININAVISDNNVPIETDGYTQQLQEFDRVYIELFNKSSKIRAGHIDLIQENNFFGNFSQKVTGLQVQTQINHSNATTQISGTGSITRGEFRNIKIEGQNGNQGPYRLTGNNNELYVIVVSGSERVYLDGVLLNRGENEDYVINYNTGELTFTSNQLITNNSRIAVEYLYTNRSYSQFLAYGGIVHESNRFKIAGHFYSNSDNKNTPLSDNLSNEDKQILANAGNNTNKMFNTTAVESDYDADKILYKKIIINGVEIFERSKDSNVQLYQVTFSLVGENKGNYIKTDVEVNGKVFSYTPPINGIPQGNYEPTRQLIPPKRLQLYTLNTTYKLKKDGMLGLDLAMSNEDLNLFSNTDDKNNIGFATRISGNRTYKSKNWLFTPQFEFSFIKKQFRTIQRLRTIEFTRDFNLDEELEQANQTYLKGSLITRYKDKLNLHYNLHYLKNKELYQGIKQDLTANYKNKKDFGETKVSILNSEKANQERSKFLRHNTLLKRKVYKTLWLGAQYTGESNQIKNLTNNKFNELSFKWIEYQALAGIGDSTTTNAQLKYYYRKDDSVRLGKFERMTNANGIVLDAKLINQQTQRLSLSTHYRSVKHRYQSQLKEDFITGNIRWYKSFLQNGAIANAYYELGGGVEPQREFEYVKVTDGLGIYKWTDYNNDGIEQLDEFEVAEFNDQAQYVRVYTNTTRYVKTNKNALTFSLKLNPKKIFKSNNHFLGRWSFLGSIQNANSLLKNNNIIELNPFVTSKNLLSKSENIRATLNFNQGSSYKWSAAYSFSSQVSQTYVFTGKEARSSQLHNVNLRYKPWESIYFLLDVENGFIQSQSDLFSSRRFIIDAWQVKPEIIFQTEKSLSAKLSATYQNKNNSTGIELLNQFDLGSEFQWNDREKSSVFASFNYVKNNFIGNENSVIGNQMMEGLRAGNNFVWQLLVQRQLTSFLNLNISYDGRKTETNKTIHTGSVQVQARF